MGFEVGEYEYFYQNFSVVISRLFLTDAQSAQSAHFAHFAHFAQSVRLLLPPLLSFPYQSPFAFCPLRRFIIPLRRLVRSFLLFAENITYFFFEFITTLQNP